MFITTDTGAPGTWASWGDAGILNSIQNGLAMSQNENGAIGSNPHAIKAANAWLDYFKSFENTGSSIDTNRKWGIAEGLATTYGRVLSQDHGQQKSTGEMLFLLVGDGYRTLIANRLGPETTGNWPGPIESIYDWFMDTSSSLPGNISPVAIPAYPLLQK